jgi:hypothetical protein
MIAAAGWAGHSALASIGGTRSIKAQAGFSVSSLHYGVPADTITLTDNLGSGNNFAINSKQSVDAIKGRISYLFSIH